EEIPVLDGAVIPEEPQQDQAEDDEQHDPARVQPVGPNAAAHAIDLRQSFYYLCDRKAQDDRHHDHDVLIRRHLDEGGEGNENASEHQCRRHPQGSLGLVHADKMVTQEKVATAHGEDFHMPSPHDHAAHHHGPVVHAPPADASTAYRQAFDAARPDPGRTVVAVNFEAREFEWTIAPGATMKGWGFNGQVPGPTIEARVGDVLEVRFTNRLAEATTLHWHGLRIPASMDGTDMVQSPVKPGESFIYRFRLPDAGTFWYHPHVNESEQMERGLYGALIVRADAEPMLDGEQVLILDDLKLDAQGQMAKFGGLVQWHDGREGNARLVNGKREPQLHIAAGQIERWRIINVSSARYVRLSIGGAPFQNLGNDVGLVEAAVAGRGG